MLIEVFFIKHFNTNSNISVDFSRLCTTALKLNFKPFLFSVREKIEFHPI